jgi:thiamine-phosphate pyrophosphorylase
VGLGPLFTTASKGDAGPAIGPEGVRRLRERCGRLCVAIGGITVENALGAIEAGADGVAVIRSVFGAESPERAARELRRAIGT